MSFLIKLCLAALILYGIILLAGYFGQRALMYFPDRARIEPDRIGLKGVEERVLDTPDGERVIAWYGEAKPGQPTLLYFHGNGGGLADRAPRIERFMDEGWGIYMMAYRGYSGSSGTPSEAANVADAKLAYDTLVAQGVRPERIILYGESLGSGVAAQVAAEKPAAGLILDAPYTSVVDVGANVYPYLPVRLLLRDRYETGKVITKVHMPVLILHGDDDRVIPVSMGRALAKLANEPKRLVIFPGGGHSDLYFDGNDALAAIKDWVATLKR